VPGTNIRFGWDPIIGLVPWLGDVTAALFACVLVVAAHRMAVPRVVQLRMLLNVIIDVLIGLVPVAGDIADVFWKANTKNMALIERHAHGPQRATPGDWLFVLGILLAIVAVAALPLIVVYWIVRMIGGAIG